MRTGGVVLGLGRAPHEHLPFQSIPRHEFPADLAWGSNIGGRERFCRRLRQREAKLRGVVAQRHLLTPRTVHILAHSLQFGSLFSCNSAIFSHGMKGIVLNYRIKEWQKAVILTFAILHDIVK